VRFEGIGLGCENPECKGMLEDYLSEDGEEFFRRCNICGQEFHRRLAQEQMDWVLRTIKRFLKGEGSN
jgi:hypothetical protein